MVDIRDFKLRPQTLLQSRDDIVVEAKLYRANNFSTRIELSHSLNILTPFVVDELTRRPRIVPYGTKVFNLDLSSACLSFNLPPRK
jgi:hypothetical protein